MKNSRKMRKIFDDWQLYLLLLSPTLFLILFHYVPLYGVLMAFKNYNISLGIINSPWADQNGLEHFRELFFTPRFGEVFRNTVWISLGNILTSFLFPVLFALLINEIRANRVKKALQTIMYLPHFVSWVITYSAIYSLLSMDSGIVNKIIVALGGDPVNFMASEAWFYPLVFVSNIWKTAGWGTLIYLPALAGINPDLYEAAALDGAGAWKRMLHISIPGILPTIIVLLILNAGNAMNAGFDQIFNLSNDAVVGIGEIIDTYVYKLAMVDGDYSLATAAGLFKGVINCALLLFVNKMSKVFTESGLF